MSESKEIAVAEQPQQLITIEPAKYVALVFESFRKKFDAYKAEADEVTIDVTTTAGMKTAVEWRAKFRDEIRIASEAARKERKAPILEIGRLLDGAAKEIADEVAPYESRFDAAIKAEEKRKDDEKIAKAVAESARITAIRQSIDGLRSYASSAVGRSSMLIAEMIETLEAVEITLETHQEFAGEAEMAKVATVSKLGEMLSAQIAAEQAAAEAARQAEADRIERERVAEANRVEAKRLADLAAELERQAQAARDAQAEADRIAREQREAADREAQAAREEADRIAAAKLAERQAEMDRQQAAIDAARAEQERIAREAQERAEAEARAAREAEEAAAAAEAQRIAGEAAAEAARVQAEKDAAEAARIRRERVDFLKNGPDEKEIILLVANHYGVSYQIACNWIGKIEFVDFTVVEEKAA